MKLAALQARIDRLVATIRDGHLQSLGATIETGAPHGWLIDPEAIAMALDESTPARVVQEFGTWLTTHEKLFSPARLRAWSNALPDVGCAVDAQLDKARHVARDRQLAPTDVRQPALRRLRLRSLLGSGSRVEIVLALAIAPAATKRLTKLTGFTEQALRVELRALVEGGWIDPAGTFPEGYYLTEELVQVVGDLPAGAAIPWMHVVSSLRRLQAALELLLDGGRGAELEALSVLRTCRYEDRATRISWGQRDVPTPVSAGGLVQAVAGLLAELEDLSDVRGAAK